MSLLQPKRTKYRRPHKVSYEGKAKGNKTVDFGEYGLQALEGGWISNRQIESCRVAMTKYFKKQGKLWIRIFPHMSLTKKPLEVRMGSGKGAPDSWVAVVKEGTIMFECSGVSEELMKEALTRAKHKLSVKTRIVKKGEEE